MTISKQVSDNEYQKFKESPYGIPTVRSDKPDQDILGDKDGGSDLVYVGYAAPGTSTSTAAWKIIKITRSGGVFAGKRYANGTALYDKKWDDRATYTYI